METTAQGLVSLMDLSYKSWITVELTDEEKKLIIPCGIRRERVFQGFFTTGNLGYIDPSKVKEFYDHKLKQRVLGSPDLKVRIEFEDLWESSNLAGSYNFMHRDIKSDYTLILSGPILVSDVLEKKINPKYVYKDNSGRIIPITRERIEMEIQNGIEQINRGYGESFNEVEKLAKVAGLDFLKEIEQAKQYNQIKDLEGYSQQENLDEVLIRLESWANADFCIDRDEEMGAVFGEEETLKRFLKMVPKVNFPTQGLKERALKFLKGYSNTYCQGEIRTLREELEEKTKEISEQIEYFEKEKNRMDIILSNLK